MRTGALALVVLAMLMGQWHWLWARFEGIDERLDRLEQGQAEIMRLLQALER